jgi:hypothetical protein
MEKARYSCDLIPIVLETAELTCDLTGKNGKGATE